MNRGSDETRPPPPSQPCGFNEAPIHESGKSALAVRVAQGWKGFNEAPIHESGKLRPPDEGAARQAASMRPRFMNRGSPGTLCIVTARAFQLQ